MTKHRLFPLTLYGQGSADVESFPSYLHRAAYEHGVYVGELMRFSYRYAVDEIGGKGRYPNSPYYIKTEELVRPSNTTSMLVELFEVLTRQRVSEGVLWFLKGSIGRSKGEISSGFKWCPECFSEMEKFSEAPYFKLIWHLEPVKFCHIHRTTLLEECSFCGCRQTSYIKKRPIGVCQDCGAALSKRKNRLKATDVSHSWELTGVDLIQLFHDLGQNPHETIRLGGMRKSLDSIFDHYWALERERESFTR